MEKRYKKSPDFLLRKAAGEYLLIPVNAAGAYGNSLLMLNETGAFLWENLSDDGSTAEELCDKAKGEFRYTDGAMEDQIKEFITQMLQAGLMIETEEKD